MSGRTGYVWGVDPAVGVGGRRWLTVPGSARRRPVLAATADAAVKAAPYADVLALVEEVPVPGVYAGFGYRVLTIVTGDVEVAG